ncbi:hypothetical protein PSTT_03430 [Puccinia striiformis]|uniref:Uncharacterized protein n=1 Tax=Puccinia striiformis TaxID=27350 RepID=A0A2S4VWH9_9BASI|nr:hypothetical protein PSTT_03430 [Puccinia striiformis]
MADSETKQADEQEHLSGLWSKEI